MDKRQSLANILAILLILAAFGLRMLDLKDPPLDFHPSRQLFSYTIARGLYYELAPSEEPDLSARAIEAGAETDRYEPRIQEGILAVIYLITGAERFWVARIMTSVFWMLAGWLLYRLAARIASPLGALFSLGYFLFLPFSVSLSRSFQPETLMVLGIVAAGYCLYRWSEEQSWKWSLAAGVVGGFAVLVKAQGIFPVAFMALLVVIMTLGLAAVKDIRVWAMALIMTLIPGIYYLGPWLPGSGAYFGSFTIAMSRLLADPGFFVRWANFIHSFMDMGVIVLAILGSLLMKMPGRAIAVGLWIGYVVLGLFFPWQIHTHNYYSAALVPTVALGVAPIGARLIEAIRGQGWVWRLGFVIVCLFAIAYPAWTARSALLGRDYRNEPGAWRNMGEELPRDAQIIALTHDYGWRLQYWGYTPVKLWPYNADFDLHRARGGNFGTDAQATFRERTGGFDYFLVTAFGELEQQPNLKQILEDYPVAQRGDGYILYDLRESGD